MNKPETANNEYPNETQIIVLGAGLSGICMGVQLKKNKMDNFVILEKASSIGGTWRENVYPGVACDVPSHLYSFSFELNPDWSHSYSNGREILDYCLKCSRKYNLEQHLELNTEVAQAKFNGAQWEIITNDGALWIADFLVSGVGGLHHPKHLDVDGIDCFEGNLLHTAEWDTNLELKNKRVAIVGTGASAAQVLPSIANDVSEITVFQRSAAWVLPRFALEISESRKKLFRKFPLLMRLYRIGLWVLLDTLGMLSLRKNGLLSKRLKRICEAHINRSVENLEIRKKLTPNYTPGCKRRCVSDDYLKTFNQPHVHLCTNQIKSIEPNGIVDISGNLHEVDIIIEATGFKAFDVATYLDIQGKDGRNLKDDWSSRISAYRSVMVPGYPNLFFLLGPNSGTGHTSALIMIESQVDFVLKSLKLVEKKNIRHLDPNIRETEKFNLRIQKEMTKMVFHSGCNAWYTNDNDENFTLWPYSAARFVREMKGFNKRDLLSPRIGADKQ